MPAHAAELNKALLLIIAASRRWIGRYRRNADRPQYVLIIVVKVRCRKWAGKPASEARCRRIRRSPASA
jgi:hypothetical protein